ncbi:rare lipoprotein A [Sphingobium sp. B2D3A]|uniref:septal ring lytic transglycosylase RlpA family protein n=1 Tax=unclassified Sphingobium TaxID=2611147 RepID=UPI0039B5403E|nr:rare lipoprotein A [Sphingobium sp. B2D3A]MCW2384390.1 rare lipoprotein A [Sphingobium sp. B2D3D]
MLAIRSSMPRALPGRSLWLALLVVPALAGCAGSTKFRPVSDTPVRIGPPYVVRGVTYTPADDRTLDMLGDASWYGSESGNQTANGERFVKHGISAAHTTLPLPSYVEVTALDTGRTILVRVNDRGPFARNRIIDLSQGAAELLGIRQQGTVQVRVRRVEPPEADRARLRAGKPAMARPDVPQQTLAPWRARLAAYRAAQAQEGGSR